MPFDHAAFLSYSHRDVAWVETLQKNLEACLQAQGCKPHKVYRDKTDLTPGRSWVTGLQQGLDQAPKVILVATPESMASPRGVSLSFHPIGIQGVPLDGLPYILSPLAS